MENKIIKIEKKGNYEFGDNYNLIFRDKHGLHLNNCNIICGNNCVVDCGNDCNVNCGNDCEIDCGNFCYITCGNNCEIILGYNCYIKGGEGSRIHFYYSFLKTILKEEEHIWWSYYFNDILINTFEDKSWKINNPEKFKELYPFVHNELDSATLF